uniref:Phosphatidylinositide phosphatase SAC2-like n=1 Tax=Callorhinchus milii TaxID=7868 RepID=A0A4W3HBR4_CALMI
MEVFETACEYVVKGVASCLSCSRSSGHLEIRAASQVDLSSAVCLGLVEGVVGKVQLPSDVQWYLVVIRQKALVGTIPGGHKVYRISRVAVIPLSEVQPVDLEL